MYVHRVFQAYPTKYCSGGILDTIDTLMLLIFDVLFLRPLDLVIKDGII